MLKLFKKWKTQKSSWAECLAYLDSSLHNIGSDKTKRNVCAKQSYWSLAITQWLSLRPVHSQKPFLRDGGKETAVGGVVYMKQRILLQTVSSTTATLFFSWSDVINRCKLYTMNIIHLDDCEHIHWVLASSCSSAELCEVCCIFDTLFFFLRQQWRYYSI